MSGPFLFPDLSAGDIASPNFNALAAMPNVIGCVLKATDGTVYDSSWFIRNWPLLRAAGGSRTGSTWFRGAYHFLRQAESGAAQAHVCLSVIAAAGGMDDDDMMIIVDVEGDGWTPALARQIAGDFDAYVFAATGRHCILYADGDIGIGPDIGFAKIWTPHPQRLADWSLAQMVAFQYAGDGSYYNPSAFPAQGRYPLSVPGWSTSNGKPGVDFSVVTNSVGSYETDINAARLALTGSSGSTSFWWKLIGSTFIGGALFVAWLRYMRGRTPATPPALPPGPTP